MDKQPELVSAAAASSTVHPIQNHLIRRAGIPEIIEPFMFGFNEIMVLIA